MSDERVERRMKFYRGPVTKVASLIFGGSEGLYLLYGGKSGWGFGFMIRGIYIEFAVRIENYRDK